MIGRLLAALATIALSVLCCAVDPPAPRTDDDLVWWTTHALVKVRPGDPPEPPADATGAAELAAARNEFEPFQLVLRAQERPLADVDVEVGPLVRDEGGATIPARHIRVYLEHIVDLETRSSVAGDGGPWPDPLVPRTDAFTGERRNAFPFDLEPGRNQALWIEVYVPEKTPPGRYRGAVRVTAGGAPRFEVPMSVKVLPFTLPSTSSLATSYGFSGPAALRTHHGSYTSDDDLFELTRRYRVAALRHRVSFYGGSMAPPPAEFGEDEANIDWSRHDREVGPFLDGAVFGEDDPLPGARATSIDLIDPPALSDEQRTLYWRAWVSHYRDRSWLDRLFLYVMDEPQATDDYPEVARIGRLARRADPELRTLLTEQLAAPLAEMIDLWVTPIYCLEEHPGADMPCEERVPRSGYGAVEREGAEVWWYLSCLSHGCNTVGDQPYTGWPSYVIDAPATAHRILPWLAFIHGIDGELYYSTVEAYALGNDPWKRIRAHGGNGDGTLFYPGTPERIGGTSHIPVESLRLKLIREGLEDYEYLTLLAENGREGPAREIARKLAPGIRDWDPSPEALYAARQELARELTRHAVPEAAPEGEQAPEPQDDEPEKETS